MANLPHVAVGDPLVTVLNAERDQINQNTTDIPKKIDKPTLPKKGDVLVYDGTKWASLNIGYFSGAGGPEGQVAAPVASRYTDTDNTLGALEWVKASGTGNTGWLLVAGDTGLRNISTLVDKRNNGVVNAAQLRRSNNIVDVYFDLKMPTSIASPYTLLQLPIGFRPPFDRYGGLQDNNESAAASTLVAANGNCQLFTIVSAKSDRWTGTWITRDPWPTALPGAVA